MASDGRVAQSGAQEQLRRVQRAAGHDHDARAHDAALARLVDVLDAGCPAVLDQHALDRRVRPQLEHASRERVGDVRVHRRLAGVRRAALEAGAALLAVRIRVRGHRLERGAELAERGLDGAHALRPIGALANAEHLLDAGVVRGQVGRSERLAALVREPGRRVPLGEVVPVRAQRDLGVDRGRASDAAAAEERDDVAVRQRGEAQRPPDVVVRLRLPAREVGGRAVRAALQEQHVASAPAELGGDDASAGARPDHHDVELALHAIPRNDQSLRTRVASGELKSISAKAPRASRPGATKSL